jgi:hypothetical protein
VTVVADRYSVASGTTRQPDPPPELPNVDDAQLRYLHRVSGSSAASVNAWTFYTVAPRATYVIEPGRQARLLACVTGEISRLQALRRGWDGYHAEPITQYALYSVARLLAMILRPDSEAPQFAPLADGGIQIEWLAGGDDIEFEVRGTGEVNVLATTASGESIAEGTMNLDYPSELAANVANFLRELSARAEAGRSGS